MKALFNTFLFATGILFCSCSAKDDVILAAPDSNENNTTVVASSSSIETKQTVSPAELENRFKGCKAHW